MPTLEVLEILKEHINRLGNEPRILRERGESLEDVAPVISQADSSIEDLVSDDTQGGGIDEMEALLGSYVADMGSPGTGKELSFEDFSIDPPDENEEGASAESPEEPVHIPEVVDDEAFSLDDLDSYQAEDDTFIDGNVEESQPVIEELLIEEPFEGIVTGGESGEQYSPLDEQVSPGDRRIVDTDEEHVDIIDSLVADDVPAKDPGTALLTDESGDIDSPGADLSESLSLDEELLIGEKPVPDEVPGSRDLADDSQQFSMDDFGEQYNFDEKDEILSEGFDIDSDQQDYPPDEVSDNDDQFFSIETGDIDALQQTLSTLPRNLKIALEELLSDKRWGQEDLKPIIAALIVGESPKKLVLRFKNLTKREIELPRNYAKRSGLALEKRRSLLVYLLLRDGWPIIRLILLVLGISWLLGASVFMWVYRPIKAHQLYTQGLIAVRDDDLEMAKEYFHDAWDGWPLFYSADKASDRIADSPIVVKGWKAHQQWLQYARALRRRKHWDATMQFYEGYLSVKPASKEIRLEYSRFLSRVSGRYQEALDLIENAPVKGKVEWDREYTLAAGDVLLDWAEDNPAKYEEARERYAKVLELSRNDERALLSMMRYHLRLENSEEIERLIPVFNNEIPGQTDAPQLAAEVFSGLGQYQLAKGHIKNARQFINRAISADPNAPEPSFINALYWHQAQDQQRELSAYIQTLVNLEGRESLTRQNLKIRILSLAGMGRIQALNGNLDAATTSYYKSTSFFENAENRNQLGTDPVFGQIYLDIGNIKYTGIESEESPPDLVLTLAPNQGKVEKGSKRYSELTLAERYYNRAQEHFGSNLHRGAGLPPGALYRRGYVKYELGKGDALLDFHQVARVKPDDYEVRIALATVLLESGDYEASRSQYREALDLLDKKLLRTGKNLNPLEKQEHSELLIRYILVWNNLGVGRARSAARGGGEKDYAAALGAFTIASEYMDKVYETMPDLVRRGVMAVRSIEGRRIIRNVDGFKLPMEKTTVPYLNRMRLLGLEKAPEGTKTYLVFPDIPSDMQL